MTRAKRPRTPIQIAGDYISHARRLRSAGSPKADEAEKHIEKAIKLALSPQRTYLESAHGMLEVALSERAGTIYAAKFVLMAAQDLLRVVDALQPPNPVKPPRNGENPGPSW